MKKSDDNLIERTLEVWQPRNGHPRLSNEDARAILENVKGFTLLLEWETNEQAEKAAVRMNLR